ncbi:MAG: hypothetical protein AAF191_02100 [Verrucomicrobiota bacterium]
MNAHLVLTLLLLSIANPILAETTGGSSTCVFYQNSDPSIRATVRNQLQEQLEANGFVPSLPPAFAPRNPGGISSLQEYTWYRLPDRQIYLYVFQRNENDLLSKIWWQRLNASDASSRDLVVAKTEALFSWCLDLTNNQADPTFLASLSEIHRNSQERGAKKTESSETGSGFSGFDPS